MTNHACDCGSPPYPDDKKPCPRCQKAFEDDLVERVLAGKTQSPLDVCAAACIVGGRAKNLEEQGSRIGADE